MQAARLQSPPPLHELILETTRALAHLDADRLEALRDHCVVLERAYQSPLFRRRYDLVSPVWKAQRSLCALAAILEQTRVNLAVLRRLDGVRGGDLGYGPDAPCGWAMLEGADGLH